jgi:hypothetical protein
MRRPYRGAFAPHEAALDLSRAEVGAAAPVRVSWDMGAAAPGDILWTTSAYPLLVHARVVELLTNAAFTGWATYEVEVITKTGKAAPNYFGLAITGRCDRIDLSRSPIVLNRMPGGWNPQFQGYYFVPDSWDGSDLFMERPDRLGKTSSIRMVTEGVYKKLKEAKCGNLQFTRLSEDLMDTSVYTIALAHLLPEDFASRLEAAYRAAGVPRPDWV